MAPTFAQAKNAPAGLRARRIALDILLRVETELAFADVLLGQQLIGLPNPPDRRLVTQLVLGTLAWQGRLDYELQLAASRPLAAIDLALRVILRMGLYQLRMLDRIPPHAAVDTAVRLARATRGGAGAAGFVNAILRAALRQPAAPPDPASSLVRYLAIIHSHPEWLVAQLIDWFGAAEAASIMAANNQAAPNVIRLNLARGTVTDLTVRLKRDGMTVARRGLFPATAILDGAPLFDTPAFRQGLFVAQSEASQLVAHLLAPPRDTTVIDCAAAPGGKSTHLAELAGPRGAVIALDLKLNGLKQTRHLARRLRLGNLHCVRADTSRALPITPGSADYVLLDAPCTGLGTLREHPEIRWRLAPGDFARMGQLQTAMLAQAASLVRPGGVIVYAICSFAPAECEEVVRTFIARHPEFRIAAIPAASAALAPLIDAGGFMRTRPDRGSRDGFFAARLQRSR